MAAYFEASSDCAKIIEHISRKGIKAIFLIIYIFIYREQNKPTVAAENLYFISGEASVI